MKRNKKIKNYKVTSFFSTLDVHYVEKESGGKRDRDTAKERDRER